MQSDRFVEVPKIVFGNMYFILNFGFQMKLFDVSFQILSFILVFEYPGFQMKFKSNNFFIISKHVI